MTEKKFTTVEQMEQEAEPFPELDAELTLAPAQDQKTKIYKTVFAAGTVPWVPVHSKAPGYLRAQISLQRNYLRTVLKCPFRSQ